MSRFIRKLWNDEGGFILTTEAMIIWTITVLGLVVGLVAIRDATTLELTEVANTIMTFDQTYSYATLMLVGGNDVAVVSGSNAQDYPGTGTNGATPAFYSVGAVQVSVSPTSQKNVINVAAP